jgi:hypothetical protein
VTSRRASLLLWLGVALPPLAWTLQLVAGYWVEEAACGSPGLDGTVWQAVTFVVAGALGAAGLAAAAVTFRAVRAGAGDARGRVAFLAVTSLSAALVFALGIVMTGVGVLSLDPCTG